MEVPAGQDGIQRLLAAEQEAQAIVAKARKGEGGLGCMQGSKGSCWVRTSSCKAMSTWQACWGGTIGGSSRGAGGSRAGSVRQCKAVGGFFAAVPGSGGVE